jgi:hypothetical protein
VIDFYSAGLAATAVAVQHEDAPSIELAVLIRHEAEVVPCAQHVVHGVRCLSKALQRAGCRSVRDHELDLQVCHSAELKSPRSHAS